MKNKLFISLGLSLLLFAGCDMEAPLDQQLYPETVYIVGARDKIIYRDLDMGYDQDTVYVSVAVSGSLPSSQEVTVELEEYPQAIADYNAKELSSNDILNQNLPGGLYNFPNPNAIVKKGDVYGTYPVYVKPATLHIDSLYMISLKLKSTTAFEMAENDTVVLVKFNLMNQYSGQYYMDGEIGEVGSTEDAEIYKMPRTLSSVVDGNTVRMYHLKNEWTKGTTDYRPDYCLNITVNPDNSLTIKPWEFFEILDYKGTYHPELELYDLSYTFMENGVKKWTKGYLYKERKNDDDLRILTDWIEEQRKK